MITKELSQLDKNLIEAQIEGLEAVCKVHGIKTDNMKQPKEQVFKLIHNALSIDNLRKNWIKIKIKLIPIE